MGSMFITFVILAPKFAKGTNCSYIFIMTAIIPMPKLPGADYDKKTNLESTVFPLLRALEVPIFNFGVKLY